MGPTKAKGMTMALEPETQREANELREHDELKERHAHDIEENEAHKESPEQRKSEHKEHEDSHYDIHFKEKGERRRENEETAALTEEANAILGNE